MDIKRINANTPAVKPLGVIDYVDGAGDLVRHAPCDAVMVRSQADLEALAGAYPPGTVAFTAGGAGVCEKAGKGNDLSVWRKAPASSPVRGAKGVRPCGAGYLRGYRSIKGAAGERNFRRAR